jgi:hypothetical protein
MGVRMDIQTGLLTGVCIGSEHHAVVSVEALLHMDMSREKIKDLPRVVETKRSHLGTFESFMNLRREVTAINGVKIVVCLHGSHVGHAGVCVRASRRDHMFNYLITFQTQYSAIRYSDPPT